jgi:hypothetical protein
MAQHEGVFEEEFMAILAETWMRAISAQCAVRQFWLWPPCAIFRRSMVVFFKKSGHPLDRLTRPFLSVSLVRLHVTLSR